MATYDGGTLSTGIKLYLNGVRVDDTTSEAAGFGGVENLTGDVHIGRSGTAYANGVIDDIRIYNTALTEAEVKNLYSSRGMRSRFTSGYRTNHRGRYK